MAAAIPRVAGLVAGAARGCDGPALPGGWLVALLGGCTLLARLRSMYDAAVSRGGRRLRGLRRGRRRALRQCLASRLAAISPHHLRVDRARGAHPRCSGGTTSAGRRLGPDMSSPACFEPTRRGRRLVPCHSRSTWSGSAGWTPLVAGPILPRIPYGGVLLTVARCAGRGARAESASRKRSAHRPNCAHVARYLGPWRGRPGARHEPGAALPGCARSKSAALVSVMGHGSAPDEATAFLRASSRRAINASSRTFGPRAAAIVSAISRWRSDRLDSDVSTAPAGAGTVSVIAVSGGDVALLAGFTLAVFHLAGVLVARPCSVPRPR